MAAYGPLDHRTVAQHRQRELAMALLTAVAAERSTPSIQVACLAAVVDAMPTSQSEVRAVMDAQSDT